MSSRAPRPWIEYDAQFMFARRLAMRVRLGLLMALSLPILLVCPVRGQTGPPSASDASSAAKALFTQGRYDDAITSYRQIQSEFPTAAADAQRMIGVCHQWKKDYAKAMAAYRSLLIDYPESEAAGEAYYWLGLCDEALGNVDAAIANFANEVKYFPANARAPLAMLKAGERYQEKRNYDEAIRQFEQVLTAAPSHAPRANLLIGICYQTQKKYDAAIIALKTGIRDAGSTGDTRREMNYRLQECYQSGASFDDAAALAKELATAYPADAILHKFNVGVAYQAKGDYGRAFDAYRDVTLGQTNDPKVREARLRGEECLRAQRRYADDLAYLQKLHDEQPEMAAESLIRQSEVHAEWMNEPGKAIALLHKIAVEEPGSPFVVEAEARIASLTLYGMKEEDSARTLLKSFIINHPDYNCIIVVRQDLAFCDYLQQKYATAATLFVEAYANPDPANYKPLVLYFAADSYMRAQEYDKARLVADRLIKLHADDVWAQQAIERYVELTHTTREGAAKS
jgi:tetratricopeptide (TPR) repeat protein